MKYTYTATAPDGTTFKRNSTNPNYCAAIVSFFGNKWSIDGFRSDAAKAATEAAGRAGSARFGNIPAVAVPASRT